MLAVNQGSVFARTLFVAIGACRSIMLVRVLLNDFHASSTVREVSIESQEAECKSVQNL